MHSLPASGPADRAQRHPDMPRIGTRYRDWRLNGPYDALIIGSGMGGLSTAVFLSTLGWKVAVLEQHYTAGGYSHSYEREGYEWDVGLHYVGDMHEGGESRRVMDFLTAGQVQWAPMGPVYDRFVVGGETFDAPAGREVWRAEMVKRFPQEAAAIDQYLRLLKKVSKTLPLTATAKVMPPWAQRLLRPLVNRFMPEACKQTTAQVLDSLTANAKLKAVLAAQWGDYGLPPSRSSFMAHAVVAGHFMGGGYYPVGGSWRLAQAMLPQVRATGGDVFTYAKVDQIVVEGGQVKGVRMADGHHIDCACVISGAGATNTFQHLLPADVVRSAGYADKLASVKPSGAHLGVYIGLKQTAEALGLPKTNLWVYPGTDHDGQTDRHMADVEQPFPVVYISFPSAKDPDFLRRHPGRATIEIVAPTNYAWFSQWAGTTWGKRGDDYDAFKARLGERLMAVLYEQLPQLRGQVDYMEVSTPLSTAWFSAYQQGELYGLDHDPQRFAQGWLGPRTAIPGLWLTGQDVMSCGIMGAAMGGMMSAMAVAGMRRMGPLMGKVMKGQHQRAAAPLAEPSASPSTSKSSA